MFNVLLGLGPVQYRAGRCRGLILMWSALVLIRQGLFQLCRGAWIWLCSL